MNKPIKLLIGADHIQLRGFDKSITFEKGKYTISQNQDQYPQEIGIYGIVGVYNINGKLNLLYITEAEEVCNINGQKIYMITQISSLLSLLNPIEQQLNKQVEAFLSKCTYFSLTYDLTLPLPLQHQPEQSERSIRYWWNFHGFKVFLEQQIPKCWCVKIIQGFIGLTQCVIENQKLFYILIARRETLRGGTRYNHRGINMEGAAANTVETEQLIQYQDKLYCHLQIRGSAPVFWEQTGIRAITQITQDIHKLKMAIVNHFKNLKKHYGSLLLIDLMANDKPNENIISCKYREMIYEINLPQIQHQNIDFNHHCKNYRFDKLNQLLNRDVLNQQSFTKFQNDKLMNIQNGIVRTNCLDCLDRTNVFQTKIAFYVTNLILQDIGISVQKQFKCDSILDLSDQEHVHPLIKQIKILWGEAGDSISNLYAGTDSSITKLQKSGGSTWTGFLEHKIKGFQRFYNQNITDEDKQKLYSYIVGENSLDKKQFLDHVELIQKQSPIVNKNLLIMVVGYNAQNQNISDFYHIIESRQIPLVVIVTFQNVNRQYQSQNYVLKQLESSIRSQLGTYNCIKMAQNDNQYTFIFSKNNLNITEPIERQLKSGEKDIGFIHTFKIEDQTVQLISLNLICSELRLYDAVIKEQCIQSDIQFITGILNPKILQHNEQILNNNKQDYLALLYTKDQLFDCLSNMDLLKGYQEGIITFQPKNNSWPNRVLYGSKVTLDAFNVLAYEETGENGIRLLTTIDTNLLELEDEDMRFSQKFYETSDDEFEVIK